MKGYEIQWHPGFVAAMSLEMDGNLEELVFEREYNLNTNPLEIDLLIIKKEKDAQIENEIGRFFRRLTQCWKSASEQTGKSWRS